ncbi:hypothetical protein EON71_01050 [bacterium]|nr:MAG: hypothetical protein EON71_01050 [bacterium]
MDKIRTRHKEFLKKQEIKRNTFMDKFKSVRSELYLYDCSKVIFTRSVNMHLRNILRTYPI